MQEERATVDGLMELVWSCPSDTATCDEDLEPVRAYATRLANQPAEVDEARKVCAEAYQVVGILLDDMGLFNTEPARKILDNLSEQRLVHDDVLPWESVRSKVSDEGEELRAAAQAALQPLKLYQAYGWSDRGRVIKNLEEAIANKKNGAAS